jgi:L-lactate dehydrogenase (cytochrome)
MVREPINLEDVRRIAKRRLPRPVFDFIEGGAEDERSVGANTQAFQEIAFRPRVLRDVSERRLAVRVLGQDLDLPVYLAPAGLARVVHPAGEVAAARGARDAGTAFGLSTASSCPIEDVCAGGDDRTWFQLYLWQSREVVASLIQRAQASGAAALVLTVDVPIVGQRERDLRNGMTLPPRISVRNGLDAVRRVRWVSGFLTSRPITFENFLDATPRDNSAGSLGTFINRDMVNPAATWDDLAWVRELWSGPLAVKGILSADDAKRAVDAGVDAIMVSNHGGRQLDGAVAPIRALPEIVAAVGDRADVMVDGGVRRGSDVVKALALGAKAVGVGRPWFYGLALGGAAGVERVLEILRGEIDRTLALLGCPDAAELDASFLTDPRSPLLARSAG